MKIIPLNEANIQEIATHLREGELVIMPTETMYGAMVDATNYEGVKKLTKYKNRPLGKPYSIAVTDFDMAEKYAEVNETAKELYRKFLPGPLTIISKAKDNLAIGVTSERGTVGVRIPDYKLVIDVIKELGRPITATSANASYKRRPYKVTDILDNISDKQKSLIDLIVDAGELPHREPSTVIDTTMDDITTLRQGEINFNTELKIVSKSEEDTRGFGKELWQKYENFLGQRAIVFALEGPMGAGKTQLTKGLAKAMGIEEEVISPTFILENQYLTPSPSPNLGEGKRLIFDHVDAWRMESPEELEALEIKELIHDKSVIAIEWADKVSEMIRKYNEEAIVVWVKIAYGREENEREIGWGVEK